MKCFSFLLLYSISSYAALFNIEPLNDSVLEEERIVEVQIKSPEGLEVPKKYLKRRVTKEVFLLDQLSNDKFTIMLSRPQQKPGDQKEKEFKLDDEFILQGFEIKYIKKDQDKNLTIFDVDYQVAESFARRAFWPLIIFIIFFFMPELIKLARVVLRSIHLKRKRRAKLKRFQVKLQQAKERKDFEEILKVGSEFGRFDSYHAYKKMMDGVQYKPEWTKEDFQTVRKARDKFLEHRELKRGI